MITQHGFSELKKLAGKNCLKRNVILSLPRHRSSCTKPTLPITYGYLKKFTLLRIANKFPAHQSLALQSSRTNMVSQHVTFISPPIKAVRDA